VDIKTGEKKRLYESDNSGVYERVSSVLDIDAGRFIVSRESPTEVEQAYLVEGDRRNQLTRNEDPTPDITKAPKERFFVERADGFRFKVTVTLPPGYQQGTRLPAFSGFIRVSTPTRRSTTGPIAPSTKTPSRISARDRCIIWCGSLYRCRARRAHRRSAGTDEQ